MRETWTGRCRPATAAAALAAVLSGCSSLVTPAPTFSALFNSATTTTASGAGEVPTDVPCPDVGVRAGAATMTYSGGPTQDSAMNLRYQVGISQTARECKLAGNILTMRVGVQGRIILGPAGGPGQIEVPVRLAVVHEGPEPKTIFTKLNRVSVTIPPGDGNVQFSVIEDQVSFPMPRGGEIDEYIVYVGFDPHGAREPVRRRPERPSRRPTG